MRVLFPLERLAEINWFIVAVASAIAAIGLLMMVSAGGGELVVYATQQFARFCFAFVLMIFVAIIPMRAVLDYAYVLYALCLLVLAFVDLTGHVGMGAQRWIKIGGFNFQPSEFMKLAVIVALARYFHQMYPENITRPLFLLPPALLILAPALLILREPNLGTATILISVGAVLCFLAGVQWRYFIGVGMAAIAAAPLAWHFLHDYQKRRVLTFLDPERDPLGAGYNILQSVIAIGSGGFFGKGFLQGSQNQLDFLPEKHTDFIFTMYAEEFGFLGGIILLGLYYVLITSGMVVAQRSKSTFGSMLAAGVTAMLFVHVMINIGMVMGLLPVVGVPLPLMSYGGSSMVSAMLAMGLMLNAYVNRDMGPARIKPKL